uniref:NADH:ubiquinone reductase (H(+)-translocating) n=1 Tax=Fasciolopsis buskii TaxID=27845 RepID=A0A191TEA9_9TREM|nr:NADH dehydrogenase subunit 5 [Fasciolopsis buski]ANI86944.1 NADH dehydrogenase subunit 5 [Fasciolopsis buski]
MLLIFLGIFGLYVFWYVGQLYWLGNFSVLAHDSFSSFGFMLDDVSMGCVFMLLCCGGVALVYCFHYFSGGVEGSLLFPLMVWFLGVMCILVFSSSLVFSLIFWEYLGLVSFFLILFYSNSSSLRASLITLFASRFGDVSMFVIIMCVSWWIGTSGAGFIFLYLLVVLTKSAGFPFISWLLEAMRAPTPVSSLVHSSTLVAAGVWFVLRYSSYSSWWLDFFLVYFCLLSIIITAVAATVFMDLKKIVALSTCNNVSWCLLFFVCGDVFLALLQLITHGLCKCYLFMSVGDLMCQSGSSQSSVGVYLGRYSGVYLPVIQSFLVLSLCGLPFLGVFFSKHCFFSGLLGVMSLGGCLLFLICLFLSYVYSVRFVLLLVGSVGGLSFGYFSGFMIICPLVVLGSVLNFLVSLGTVEVISLSSIWSVVVLSLQGVGSLVGWWFYYLCMGYGRWSSLVWGSEGFVSLFYSWFLVLSSVCVSSFYRWEIYFLDMFFSLGSVYRWSFYRGSLFSLSFMILGMMGVFFASYIF